MYVCDWVRTIPPRLYREPRSWKTCILGAIPRVTLLKDTHLRGNTLLKNVHFMGYTGSHVPEKQRYYGLYREPRSLKPGILWLYREPRSWKPAGYYGLHRKPHIGYTGRYALENPNPEHVYEKTHAKMARSSKLLTFPNLWPISLKKFGKVRIQNAQTLISSNI